MEKDYTEYWNNVMANRKQPKHCEVFRLIMVAEHYFKEHQEYCDKDDVNRCNNLYEFVTYNKRPYGNKDIPSSIAFNLGWGYEENDYMTEQAWNEAMELHSLVKLKLKESI